MAVIAWVDYMSILTAYKYIVRRVVETRKSGTLCCFVSIKHNLISRLTIVSREAKKKQAVRDEQVSYLHVVPL